MGVDLITIAVYRIKQTQCHSQWAHYLVCTLQLPKAMSELSAAEFWGKNFIRLNSIFSQQQITANPYLSI